MKVVRFPQTYIDLVEIAEFLGQDDPDVAVRFYESYEETLEAIKRFPRIGSIRSSIAFGSVRMWFVSDFEKVLIFYKESIDEVAIVRIIHSSRDYTRFI